MQKFYHTIKKKNIEENNMIMSANTVAEQRASSQDCRVPFATAVISLEMPVPT